MLLRLVLSVGRNADDHGGVPESLLPRGDFAAAAAEQALGGAEHLRCLQLAQQQAVSAREGQLFRRVPRNHRDGLGHKEGVNGFLSEPKIQNSTENSEQLATMVFTNILKVGRVPIIPIILNIYDIRPDLAISLLLLEPNDSLAIACLLKIEEYHEVELVMWVQRVGAASSGRNARSRACLRSDPLRRRSVDGE